MTTSSHTHTTRWNQLTTSSNHDCWNHAERQRETWRDQKDDRTANIRAHR